ncbi:MAG: DUF1801 domain-containing protein [Eubacteriales bacterium]|nr:DUF1801 domain-containing protein [Eubacteriales bacterium]MDD4323575.1 DUF1801 domain-containing protein [Eubacteriales bacterium]MDD4541084.1 DUF1801 domain-containing protein [Eubacteriales bacterium]
MALKTFDEYMQKIQNEGQKSRLREVFSWVEENYPSLERRVAWNTPMYMEHGTYIIGFTATKNHLSIGYEVQTLQHFKEELEEREVDHAQMIVRTPWGDEIDYDLMRRMIDYTRENKKDITSMWDPR